MSDPDASGSVETRSDIKNEEVGSLEELQWSYGAPDRDNPIYNRWVFNQRGQKPDESIGDFVNALRKLIPGEIYKFKYRPVSPSEVVKSKKEHQMLLFFRGTTDQGSLPSVLLTLILDKRHPWRMLR